jgi:hypothetical protein
MCMRAARRPRTLRLSRVSMMAILIRKTVEPTICDRLGQHATAVYCVFVDREQEQEDQK